MQEHRQVTVDSLTELSLQLLERLRLEGKIKPDGLWNLYGDHPEIDGIDTEREMLEKVVTALRKENSHISVQLIHPVLLYQTIGPLIDSSLAHSDPASRVRGTIENLLTFNAQREVDVPVVNLRVGPEPFAFGAVTFHQVTDQDRDSDWWLRVKTYAEPLTDTQVRTYARVESPGDIYTAARHAGTVVDEM